MRQETKSTRESRKYVKESNKIVFQNPDVLIESLRRSYKQHQQVYLLNKLAQSGISGLVF
jgi:hypothetical protein